MSSVWHSSLTLLFVYYLTALSVAVAEQEKQFIIMKKSIFILAALLAATFANAQITLEKTLDGFYTISANYDEGIFDHYVQSPYFYNTQIQKNEPSVPHEPIQGAPRRANASNKCVLNLYDVDDFSLYKTIEIENVTGSYVCLVSKNILSTDNKVCFCIPGGYGTNQSYIYNEDGQLVATINGDGNFPPSLLKVNDRYLLICRDYEKTYIYSVPGNGEAQAVSTPSSPKRSARKIARDGQVLVQTDNNTYTLTGAEVK